MNDSIIIQVSPIIGPILPTIDLDWPPLWDAIMHFSLSVIPNNKVENVIQLGLEMGVKHIIVKQTITHTTISEAAVNIIELQLNYKVTL